MLDDKINILNEKFSSILTRYYFGPDHPSKIRLWNLAFRFMGYPRLKIPYGEGGWISVDYRDYLQIAIWERGAYEPEVWETLKSFATRDEILWDVGAHIGAVSIRAGMDPSIKEVHAFEPHPKIFQILSANLSMNDVSVIAHPCALSDEQGTQLLHSGSSVNSALASFIPDDRLTTAHPVACETVDHLIFDKTVPAPTLIKIDVEGYEKNVLMGARRLLTEKPPKAIVFEASADPAGKMVEPAVAHLLEQFGYKVSHIRRPENAVMDRENYLARR